MDARGSFTELRGTSRMDHTLLLASTNAHPSDSTTAAPDATARRAQS